MKKKKCQRSAFFYLPVCALLILLLSVPAGAASGKKGWVTEGKYDYYYDANGKKVSGLQKIKGRQYYFDKKSRRQYHGWARIDNKYYCFDQGRKSKGYMITGKTVNGFKLGKDGAAVLNRKQKKASGLYKKKLKALVYASAYLFKESDPTMSREQKLRRMFDVTVSRYVFYVNWSPRTPAEFVLYMKNHQDIATDCTVASTIFGYFAAIIGYKHVYLVTTDNHTWTEIYSGGPKKYDINNGIFGEDTWGSAEKNYISLNSSRSEVKMEPGMKLYPRSYWET